MGYTASGTADRIRTALEQYALPTSISASREEYEAAMSLDKKSLGDEIRFVFLERIGSAKTVSLPKEDLFRRL